MKKLKLIASSLVVASVLALNPIGASAAWRQDSNGWWNTEGSSYSTGWQRIDGYWYYFYIDGYMAHNTIIDGYFLNSKGAWLDENTVFSYVVKQIFKEDGKYLVTILNSKTRLSEYRTGDTYSTDSWDMSGAPKESYFTVSVDNYNEQGEIEFDSYTYLVGKTSGNVYIYPHQGCMAIYQIKDNQKVKTFKWIGGGTSSEWRK